MKVVILILLLVVPGFFCNSQPPAEEVIGNTWYDVQTTRSMQNRIYYFPDGSIGAVFNMAFDFLLFPDLGVGYNYFDGNNWGPLPTQSITSGLAKNPSYTKFGEDGEIVVSEGENGLFINYRMTKGEGDWEQFIFQGPTGYEKLYSPQIVTTGNYNEIIHLLALKKVDTIQFEEFDQDNCGQVLYSQVIGLWRLPGRCFIMNLNLTRTILDSLNFHLFGQNRKIIRSPFWLVTITLI